LSQTRRTDGGVGVLVDRRLRRALGEICATLKTLAAHHWMVLRANVMGRKLARSQYLVRNKVASENGSVFTKY
jgi:hypothetical protein